MDISFEQLRAFRAVAETGSFSRAAQRLYRTQSAISVQVANLEQALGRTLLHRTTRRVELTEAGRLYLEHVQQAFRSLALGRQRLDDLEREVRGPLSLSTSDTTACYRLPDILQTFQHEFPEVELRIHNATSIETIEKVQARLVDVGIATLRDVPPKLTVEPLFPRHDWLICAPDHPLARSRRVFLKDLEAFPAVVLDDRCSSRRILDAVCRAHGVTLNVRMELSSIEVVKSLVRVNSGISIVPAESVRQEIARGELVAKPVREMEDTESAPVGLVYHPQQYRTRAADGFIALARRMKAPAARARRRR